MGNYQNLNVLNLKKRNDYMSDDAVTDVANLISSSGCNRSQRRKIARDLGKVETIMAHTQKRLDRSMLTEYQTLLDKDMVHFCCGLAITLMDRYKWKEDDTHDQISSMIESVTKTLEKYANMGYTTEDMAELVEERTGIQLIP
jgi:hypothetical protein